MVPLVVRRGGEQMSTPTAQKIVADLEQAKQLLFTASRTARDASPLASEIPAVQELEELMAALNKLATKFARLPL